MPHDPDHPAGRDMADLPVRRLGRTGIDVTELGLGGYQYTGEFGVGRDTALDILRTARREGITFYDTAPMYGAGEGEELIGRAFGGSTEIRISTKVGYFEHTIARHLGDSAYQDPDAIRRVVAHSMHLLRRDYLDVLMIHEPEWPQWAIDRQTGDAAVTEAAEQLRRQGLIRAIGIGGQDAAFMTDLVSTGRIDVVLSVMHYDLAVQDIRDCLLPAVQLHQAGLVIGTPLRQGLLARAHRDPHAAMVADAERPAPERDQLARRLHAIYALADTAGMPLPELAIRYLLTDPAVSCVIPGPRTINELLLNIAACNGPLPADLISQIEISRDQPCQ
jgi:D-threo-aldose 1-dehydrogenase